MNYHPLLLLLLCILTACSSHHEHMRERLQYVSDCNRADTVFTARWLPTVDSLVSYFDPSSRSWTERFFSLPFREGAGVGSNDRMMAHYLQGRVYHDMGEAPQALECYQKAAEQADTTSADCDLYTLYAVYGQMADLFHSQFLPDDEMHALKTAERIAWKDCDTLAALTAFHLRSRPYYQKNDTDSVLIIETSARKKYEKNGFAEKASRALRAPISIYLDRCQYDKALSAMQIFEKESGWFDDAGNIKKGKELYYYDKGRCLLARDKTDSAWYYFNKTLHAGNEEAGYKGLLKLYQRLHLADSIAKYAVLFANANDSSYLHVNQKAVHQISVMYDYSRQQRIADENRAKADKMKLYLLFFILVSAMVFLLTAFIYHQIRTRNLLRINQLLSDKAGIQTLLSEKQQQMESITTAKDSEIERITQENNRMLIDSLRENQQLRRQIEELDQQLAKFSASSLEHAFFKTSMAECFQTIRDEYPKKASPTRLEWKQFTKTFRNYFFTYYSFITNGNSLTEDQMRVCMLIRLNYKEFEMAFFMNTDKQRIDRIKLQVNSKLFHTSNSSTLRTHLRQYF